MHVSLTREQLRDVWEAARHLGNGLYDVLMLLCPDVLKHVCELHFPLFQPLVDADLHHPDAVRMLAAVDDPAELGRFFDATFGPAGQVTSLFDELAQNGTLSRPVLCWGRALAYYHLREYAGTLLELENLQEFDTLGDLGNPFETLLREAATKNPDFSKTAASVESSRLFEELTFQHFLQALHKLRGFTLA